MSKWYAFSEIGTIAKYNKEVLKEFAASLLSECETESSILDGYSFLLQLNESVSEIIEQMKPTILQIVMNEADAIEAGAHKFIYVARKDYKYEGCKEWVSAKLDQDIASDRRKQIEAVCKTGGRIGDIEIKKVDFEIKDGFHTHKTTKK